MSILCHAKTWLAFAGLLALASGTAGASRSDDETLQLRLDFHGAGLGDGNGSCTLAPGSSCQGIVWAGAQSGFSIGTIGRGQPIEGAEFELIFSFSYATDHGEAYLDAVFYALDVAADGTVQFGKMRQMHEPIDSEKSHRLKFVSDRTGRDLELDYSISGGSVESQVVFGSNTLAFKTLVRTGRSTTKISEAHALVKDDGQRSQLFGKLAEPQHFSFPILPDPLPGHRRDTAVRYDATISFYPPLDRDHYPMRTRLTLNRMYWIDTTHVPGDTILPNWGTGVSYTKDIEIVPGKVLKLVFPPDRIEAPFQLEDTVIITP